MKIQTLLRHGRRNAPAPGTPAWRRYLTASKISAVMRTSPWQTRFQLWHEMAGNIQPDPPHPAVLERGHILEPAVAAWVQAHHPEWRVRDCGGRWWQVAGHYAATPDRILVDAETRDVVGLLEIKTSSHSDGWGTPGTDEIPPHYRDQVQWQLHCTGLDYVVVAALTARLEFAEYHLRRDDERIAQMCVEADKFMADLESGLEPDWSTEAGDFQVYKTLRELHPEIDDYTVEASGMAALAIRRAVKAKRLAQVTEARAKASAAWELERGRALTRDGKTIARRTARKTKTGEPGVPYITFTKEAGK